MPFDQPFFIALTQALGIGTNAAGTEHAADGGHDAGQLGPGLERS